MKPIATTLLTLLLLAPSTAFSQTRNRSSRQRPSTSTTSETQRIAQVRTQGATRVADQIKLLTKFIYLLGGVTSGIAAVDEAARRNEASPTLIQQNQQSKAQVKTSIQNFRWRGIQRSRVSMCCPPDPPDRHCPACCIRAGSKNCSQDCGKCMTRFWSIHLLC